MPRMADLARWITAAEPALGWEPGRFLAVYRENRRDVFETSFEADPVAVAIRDCIAADRPDGWTGTATELLAALNGRVSEGVRKSKLWPLSAQGLGNRIDRVAPLLRNKGFAVERHHSGQRHIIIKPPRTSANPRQIERGVTMPRRAATITQADVARVIRAAKQAGASEVVVTVGDQSVTVKLGQSTSPVKTLEKDEGIIL